MTYLKGDQRGITEKQNKKCLLDVKQQSLVYEIAAYI